MSELRKDYLTDDFVIIAKERAKRPDQFKGEETKSDPLNCPFCPENEGLLPGVIDEVGNPWRVRAVPNKFGAVSDDGKYYIQTDNEFYTYSDAHGTHEVIIETRDHNVEMHDLDVGQIVEVIDMYISRIKENFKKDGVAYPALFKNKGLKAGASIAHSHTQLISYNLVPVTIQRQVSNASEYFEKNGSCPYCNILSKSLY